jgi:hypothetical protein
MFKNVFCQKIDPERPKTLKMAYFVVKIKAGILGVKKGSKCLNKRGSVEREGKLFLHNGAI